MKALCSFAECYGATAPGSLPRRKPRPQGCAQTFDKQTFQEIVAEFGNNAVSVAYALLGDACEADVAAQRAFVELHRTGGSLKARNSTETRIYALLIKQCQFTLWFRRILKGLSWITGRNLPSRSGPTDLLSHADEHNRKRSAALALLAGLPYKERVLLVLREIADQSIPQIASILQMGPVAVRNRLLAARRHCVRLERQG